MTHQLTALAAARPSLIVPERRILIPKYQDILVELPRKVTKMAGRFKLRVGKTLADGTEVVLRESGWSNNVITNNGRNKIADNNFATITTNCHCGTGTTAETAADTALETFVAATSNIISFSSTAQASAPYYGKYVKTYRFAEGDAEGNISEVGISDQATTGDLWSRALVKDGGGSPTTITVLSDEWLDVTYEFRLYPDGVLSNGDPEDKTGTISISGTSYDYTLRAAYVNNVSYLVAGSAIGQGATNATLVGVAYGSDGALGAVTSTPSGSSQDNIQTPNSFITNATYSNGTYNRDITWTVALGDGNVTGGIRCFHFFTGMGAYQVRIGATSGDATLPKDATKVWTWVQNLAWANATIP